MLNSLFSEQWIKYFNKIISPSIFSTIRMVVATISIGFVFGFTLAIALTLYGPEGLNPRKNIYKVLNFLVNTIRSFPMLILIVAISPLTRLVVGTTVGEKAAILPLSIAATSFIARMLENTFREVDRQLIEAAKSFGASNLQIIFKVIVKESVPSIVAVMTMATVNYISATTIAGAVGGGGLGAVALNYGYQSFNDSILYTSVFILFVMVQITEFIGEKIYNKLQ